MRVRHCEEPNKVSFIINLAATKQTPSVNFRKIASKFRQKSPKTSRNDKRCNFICAHST